jgi:dGTPase
LRVADVKPETPRKLSALALDYNGTLQILPGTRAVAPYAANAMACGERVHAEPPCPMRTPFQRDRDRIVHATAFRRLTYKTQVFLAHEGDHFRTRLTHTLEVSQIARSMARLLQLDEDLAEALALAHDLGHPPFGHAGERALHAAMAELGGFDHNAQSLKVVTALERKYAGFDGLNLTFVTLEGLVKHNGPLAGPHAASSPPEPLLAAIEAARLADRLHLARFAPAEAQVAAVADDIAYNNHDIDDGLRAGLLHIEDLVDVPLVGSFVREVLARDMGADRRRMIYEVNRRMITAMIDDVVRESRTRLERVGPASVEAVRDAGLPVIAFSPVRQAELKGLREFLFKSVYRHERVMRVMDRAEAIVRDLFQRYMDDLAALPARRAEEVKGAPADERAGRITDYIAGMTDRYAIAEHKRLFDATPELL